MSHEPFIAVTDRAWFDYLRSTSTHDLVDEVNFWSPAAQTPLKHFRPGEPVFFKLKAPIHCIAGYGFFAHFSLLDLDVAWDTFGIRNGFPDLIQFLRGTRCLSRGGPPSFAHRFEATRVHDASRRRLLAGGSLDAVGDRARLADEEHSWSDRSRSRARRPAPAPDPGPSTLASRIKALVLERPPA